MRILKDIIYDDNFCSIDKLDLYCTEVRDADMVFVYFHGGGLEGGDKSDFMESAEKLTEHGISVISANYRMYPNAAFPDFIEDCAKVIVWLKKEGTSYGNFKRIFIGGSSAGAYLSMMLYFDKDYLGRYGINSAAIEGYILDAGQPTTHFNVLRERGLDNRLVRIDEAAPLYFIDSSVEAGTKTPRFLIYAAENDMVNRLEQTYLLRKTMLHFGYEEEQIQMHVMKGYEHCQYTGNEEFLSILINFINPVSLN
jgi:dipeptidyl aminopeptidase/acylaminoacyl peptidase